MKSVACCSLSTGPPTTSQAFLIPLVFLFPFFFSYLIFSSVYVPRVRIKDWLVNARIRATENFCFVSDEPYNALGLSAIMQSKFGLYVLGMVTAGSKNVFLITITPLLPVTITAAALPSCAVSTVAEVPIKRYLPTSL